MMDNREIYTFFVVPPLDPEGIFSFSMRYS